MNCVRFLVRGKVQGVGYRWFVARHASPLGLTGYARNLPDGAVEVVVRGAASAIGEMQQLLERGPEFAEVSGVEKVDILDEVTEFKTFEIR